MAALLLVHQLILQPELVRLNVYGPVINMAGRQRMLSQKVTKESLALAVHTEPQRDIEARNSHRMDLLAALAQWKTAHRAMLHGDASLDIAPVEASIAEALHRVDGPFELICTAAEIIASDAAPPIATYEDSALAVILRQEPAYLRGMEAVVAMLEASYKKQVAWLQTCGLIVMISVILLLVCVYFVVFKPAANLIRGQVETLATSDTSHRELAEMLSQARDQLELRVAQRTSQLSEANETLEREMHERQAAQLRMRELSAELAHVSRVTSLGELATGLAHEINQPLATVANYAGTLDLKLERAYPEDQESRQIVDRIKQAALRAGAIVRRMRNFAKGGVSQTSRIDLNELVSEVCELCRPEMQHAGVQVCIDLAPQPIFIQADPLQVQQVLVNLLQNATQAMHSTEGSERELRISTWIGEGSARKNLAGVEVSDSGPGFPHQSGEKPFEPFYTTRPEGLGMGLAISRTIIQQHQGTIWCENRPTGGAMVGFSLPLAAIHDSNAPQPADCLCS